MVLWADLLRELVDYGPRPGVCGVGDCARLLRTLGDPGETSGPGIDRIKPARPPWPPADHRPRIKKNSFSPLSTCPIALFGPLANRRLLKRLHGVSCSAFLVSYTARPAASRNASPLISHQLHRSAPWPAGSTSRLLRSRAAVALGIL